MLARVLAGTVILTWKRIVSPLRPSSKFIGCLRALSHVLEREAHRSIRSGFSLQTFVYQFICPNSAPCCIPSLDGLRV